MSRRLVLAAVVVSAAAAGIAPSFAASPVGVHTDTKDGVGVGVTYGNTPVVGAYDRDSKACAGLGEQVPQCVSTAAVGVTR